MPKYSRNHRMRNKKRRSLTMSGGNYSSGSSYGMYVAGTPDSQWSRTMDQSGTYGQVPGNSLIGVQGQNVTSTSQMPTSSQLSLIQKAGRKHKRRTRTRNRNRSHSRSRSRNRKGGFLGEVISQAIVPFSILGMQQSYRRKGHNNTRKYRRR